MQSILEEFAYSNIASEARRMEYGSEMAQAMRAVQANEKYLLENLNGVEKEVFRKYMDAREEVTQLTAVKNLIHGYKLGLTMTAEAFITGGESILE